MTNPQNILAGSKAAGPQGLSLVWARNLAGAPADSLPKVASDKIDTSFLDLGNCDSKGADLKANVSKTDIKSFGSIFAQGTIYTDFNGTMDVTFQETTPNTVALYRSLPLGSITPDEKGQFGVGVAMPQDVRYQLVVDGFSQRGDSMRFVLPNVANTNPGDFNMQMGQVLDRPVTFTLYPDDKGNLFYEQYLLKNLITATAANGTQTTTASWAAATAYTTGATVSVSGSVLKATSAGTSGSSAPSVPSSVGGTVTDGTVTWTRQS